MHGQVVVPFANAADLAAAWRPLTPEEQTAADALLVYASQMLRSRVSDLDERIDAGKVDRVLVRLAAILVVKRVMMNPQAARQKSRTSGPFTESITVDSAVSSGALYLSDRDVAVFLPARAEHKIGSVRLAAGLA